VYSGQRRSSATDARKTRPWPAVSGRISGEDRDGRSTSVATFLRTLPLLSVGRTYGRLGAYRIGAAPSPSG
jgi:hypothetical protein